MLDLKHLPGSSLKEESVQFFRRHPITLIPLAVATALIPLLPFGFYALLRFTNPSLVNSPIGFTLYVMGASIFLLFGLLFVFELYIEYWLDVFIVTEHRILDIDQHGLFNRTVSELRLYRVQDVTAEVKGVLHSMLNYGNVHVQTAGEVERFHFEDVADPNGVAKMILELAEKDREEHLEEAVEDFGMPDAKENVGKKIEP